MFKVNDNYLKLPGSYLFSTIGKKVAAYKAENPDRQVISLGIGDVTQPLAPAVIKAMHSAVDEMADAATFHGYAPDLGYEFLRKAIAENDYKARGVEIALDEIFISDGAKSDSGNIGDIFSVDNKIAVCDPVYPVYVDTNAMEGRTGTYDKATEKWTNVIYMPCTAETNFAPELPQETPDIIYLCFPNNPTGSYVKPTERARIVTLCREHGIALIADEVFFDYSLEPFPGNARLAGERGVLTFALDGFSKMLAAPHAKVGWIQVSGPAEDVAEAQRRLDVIADDYLPMSDIIAERIPALLNAAPAQTRRGGERVRNNLAKLHELLDADPNGLVSVLRAEGGWNVLLRVPSVIDENELVLRLIDEHKLTGQPGDFFDMTSNGYLAVSLLPEPDEFERGIRAVLNTVAALLR